MTKQIYNLRIKEPVPVLMTFVQNAAKVGDLLADVHVQADQMERFRHVLPGYKIGQQTWFHLRPDMAWPSGWILGVDEYGHEVVEVMVSPYSALSKQEVGTARQALNFLQDLFKKMDNSE